MRYNNAVHFLHRLYHKFMVELHHAFSVTLPFLVAHQMGLALIALGLLFIIFGLEVLLTGSAAAAEALEEVAAE